MGDSLKEGQPGSLGASDMDGMQREREREKEAG